MAIQVADNFQYLGQKPLDARVKYATVADMAAVAASSLYDGIMAYVVATEKNYQWKSTNTVDSTLGKWREFESGGGADNVVEGYRNPTNGLFYEEAAYTTAITGAANTLYVDLVTVGDAKDIYRWDGTGFILENTRSQDIAYDNYQALSESEKNNGTTYYIPDATAASEMLVVGNRFDKANIYTTAERMIGSWMGKPVYQKTVDCGALPNNTTKNVPHGISNLDKVIKIFGMAFSNSPVVARSPLPIVSTNKSGEQCYAWTNNENIVINANYDWSAFTESYVTLQYTKTTDGTIKIGTENDYSTDEMIVGSWIDGKPIYQKVFDVSSVSLTGNAWNDTDIDFACKYIIHSDTIWVSRMPSGSKAYQGNTLDVRSNSNDKLSIYTSYGNVNPDYVVVQYTKTTD